jgi:transposase-like protein
MSKSEIEFPETLQEAILYFGDKERAHAFLVQKRWPSGNVQCPVCWSDEVTFIASRRVWNCRHCQPNKQFSIKVGTIMEDSPIGLDKWLSALWLIANAKNGISSYEIHRSLGVTQKTAWFLLHRIRLALQNGTIEKMSGQVEADETYIGGKARFMHRHRAVAVTRGNAGKSKATVQGILQRSEDGKPSRVVLRHVKNARKKILEGNLRAWVLDGSEVFTDALSSYEGLYQYYAHKVIDHMESYAQGHVHTNGMENFWSLLKRGLKGTYVSVEPFHLFRYLDEQAFRFNERKNEDGDRGRFLLAVAGMFGKGLRYAKLTGKTQDGGSLPPTTGTWQTA